jgi:hypothetical protein
MEAAKHIVPARCCRASIVTVKMKDVHTQATITHAIKRKVRALARPCQSLDNSRNGKKPIQISDFAREATQSHARIDFSKSAAAVETVHHEAMNRPFNATAKTKTAMPEQTRRQNLPIRGRHTPWWLIAATRAVPSKVILHRFPGKRAPHTTIRAL